MVFYGTDQLIPEPFLQLAAKGAFVQHQMMVEQGQNLTEPLLHPLCQMCAGRLGVHSSQGEAVQKLRRVQPAELQNPMKAFCVGQQAGLEFRILGADHMVKFHQVLGGVVDGRPPGLQAKIQGAAAKERLDIAPEVGDQTIDLRKFPAFPAGPFDKRFHGRHLLFPIVESVK